MPKKRTKTLSKKQRDALIADVFEARRDLSGLAEAHRMSPDELAAWIRQDENQRCLSGLCLLADLQTQLMLSRYRQVAVTELIKQASGAPAPGNSSDSGAEISGASGGGGVSAEQARKACVDLLKADLKRADVNLTAVSEDQAAMAQRELASIREALYGGEDENQNAAPGLAHAPGTTHAPGLAHAPGTSPGTSPAASARDS